MAFNSSNLNLSQAPSIGHDDALSNLDCIMSIVGVDEDVIYSKSMALQLWLLGYELTDTISVFASDAIYFLSSKKKIEFLKQAQNINEEGVPEIKLLVRDRVSIQIRLFFLRSVGNVFLTDGQGSSKL